MVKNQTGARHDALESTNHSHLSVHPGRLANKSQLSLTREVTVLTAHPGLAENPLVSELRSTLL
jgi:hypothetical protein